MKKAVILLVMAMPLVLLAQKPIKPNLNKALNSWKAGQLKEAKDMIDVCVTDPKLSLDAKTFFYKGLIYASFDTTSNTSLKEMVPNSFEESQQAFAKADELNKNSKGELFYTDAFGLPVLRSQITEGLYAFYINEGAKAYQEDDFDMALKNFDKTMKIAPKDTTVRFYSGLVAYANEDFDRAISDLSKYNELGGISADAYSIMATIYGGPKEDKAKALLVVQEAMKKFPNNKDFPLMEIGYLIDLDRIADAKGGLEKAVEDDPQNKTLNFYLGYVNSKLELWEDSKKNFNAALKIDPMYFDAQYYLAQIFLIDAEKIKREMNNLGISEADKKKKLQMDKELVEKYKVALPHWEKAEKLNPSDTDVLDKLSIIYYYLGEDAKAARVEKRLKELGVEY
jgi:tetratricopeptide (TPR) repeat protein